MTDKDFISDQVSIIGAGYVGATTAYALMLGGVTWKLRCRY